MSYLVWDELGESEENARTITAASSAQAAEAWAAIEDGGPNGGCEDEWTLCVRPTRARAVTSRFRVQVESTPTKPIYRAQRLGDDEA